MGLIGESMLPSMLGALSRRDRPGADDLSSEDVLFTSDRLYDAETSGMMPDGVVSPGLPILLLPFPLPDMSSVLTDSWHAVSLKAFTVTGAMAAVGFAPRPGMLWRLEGFGLDILVRLVVDDALVDGGCWDWTSGVGPVIEVVVCAVGSDIIELKVDMVVVVSVRGTGGKEFRELVPTVLVEPPLPLPVDEAS